MPGISSRRLDHFGQPGGYSAERECDLSTEPAEAGRTRCKAVAKPLGVIGWCRTHNHEERVEEPLSSQRSRRRTWPFERRSRMDAAVRRRTIKARFAGLGRTQSSGHERFPWRENGPGGKAAEHARRVCKGRRASAKVKPTATTRNWVAAMFLKAGSWSEMLSQTPRNPAF